MAPKQSKAITIFRLSSLGYYYMVSSCCERQVGELGPPRTTLLFEVTNDAFVPCPGGQTLLGKVGEEGKNPPGQSWE